MDSNDQNSINSNETCLTVGIFDLIISEDLYFNLAHKSIFKKVLDLARNSSKANIPTNRNLTHK